MCPSKITFGQKGRVAPQPHASPTDGHISAVFDEFCRLLSEGKLSAGRSVTGLEIRRTGDRTVGSNPTLSAKMSIKTNGYAEHPHRTFHR